VDIDGSGDRFASAAVISTGVWYHVALVFDGTQPQAQRVKLWINGSLDVTAGETSATIPNYGSTLRVGNTATGAANWFSGLMDDVRFFRRALTAAEVGVLAATNAAPGVSCGPAPPATNAIPAALNGSASDDGRGGPLTLAWSQSAGPGSASFVNPNAASTSVTFNQPGLYRLRLAASDTQAQVFDELSVTVAPNPNFTTRTNLSIFVTTNHVDISWPADHLGWRLESQTNDVQVGLSTNWFTVPDSTVTNHMVMPLDPANGSVFFRIAYP
jgi:hypothetical protein